MEDSSELRENQYVPPAAALDFIARLTGNPDTPVNVRLFNDQGDRDATGVKLFGSLREHWPEVADLEAQGYGVFVVVNEGGDTDKEVLDGGTIRAVFADLDGQALPEEWDMHAQPDAVYSRDPLHHHLYWFAGPDLKPAWFRETQRRIAARYGSDPMVCNPARVMRLPGTRHQKDPARVTAYEPNPDAITHTGGRRTLDQLTAGLPAASTVEATHAAAVEDLDLPVNVNRAERYLATAAPAVEGERGNDRTYQTAVKVMDLGLSEEKALEVLEPWNERCVPPWDADALAVVVANAASYRQNAVGAWAVAAGGERFAHYVSRPEPSETGTTAEKLKRRPGHVLFSCDMAQLAPPAFIVTDLIPEDCTFQLVGDTRSFKTFIAIALGGSVATGRDTFGDPRFTVPRPGLVVLCEAEGQDNVAHSRIPAWKQANGFTGDAADAIPFGLRIVVPILNDPDDVEELIVDLQAAQAQFPDQPLRLVFIDTYARAIDGLSESDIESAKAALKAADRIRAAFPRCSVGVLHHPPEDGSKRGRGSGGVRKGGGAEFFLQRTGPKSYDVTVTNTKMQGWRELDDFVLHLEQVYDADGQPLSLVARVPTATEAAAITAKTTAQKPLSRTEQDQAEFIVANLEPALKRLDTAQPGGQWSIEVVASEILMIRQEIAKAKGEPAWTEEDRARDHRTIRHNRLVRWSKPRPKFPAILDRYLARTRGRSIVDPPEFRLPENGANQGLEPKGD